MIHYSSMVTIKRPPGDVFAALLDPERYAQWTPMVDTRFHDAEPRVGTRGDFRFERGPLKGSYEMEIVALDPGRRLEFRVHGSSLRWNAQIGLEPDGNAGTRMTYAGDLSLLGWRRLLEPLFAAEVRSGEAKEAEQLRDVLETEASSPATAPATA
jgi:carbon monoxide dehydrogenase subunit G